MSSDWSGMNRSVGHTCAVRNVLKNGPRCGLGTVEASTPFRNSVACEPWTYSSALFSTGAMVGVVRSKERSDAGSGMNVTCIASEVTISKTRRGSSLGAFGPAAAPHISNDTATCTRRIRGHPIVLVERPPCRRHAKTSRHCSRTVSCDRTACRRTDVCLLTVCRIISTNCRTTARH